jgi:hypothetical protein
MKSYIASLAVIAIATASIVVSHIKFLLIFSTPSTQLFNYSLQLPLEIKWQ